MTENPEYMLPNNCVSTHRTTSKKFAPNIRSNINRNNPTVSGGNANKINADATNVVHVNNGIRIYVIPGARILIIVTRKLIPAINVPNPDICNPIYKSQYHVLVNAMINEAYEVHPASGAPPKNHERFKKIPPNKNNQNPNEFKNGNATSRAPICNGMTAFINANNNGIAAKKIIVVPCIVIISL